MRTYTAQRDALVEWLRRDAAAHEAENFDEVGRRFDAIERTMPSGDAPELTRLRIALTFWDGWIDARNHGWPGGDIARNDWPVLARAIADDLEADREIASDRVRARFDSLANRSLGDRVQTLTERLRTR